jgi:hypothetical protein
MAIRLLFALPCWCDILSSYERRIRMLKGFKQFVMRGNVMDLAVAVVIGAAFGAVVTSFRKQHHY